MDKPQGKKFNRVGQSPLGAKLDQFHPEFETVHEIGQGFGYRYSRETVLQFFDSFNTLAPHIIYVCHVKDKFVGTSTTGSEIMTKEINLTGKLKDILASKVDTIAYGYRDENKLYLSFAGEEGTRSPHLSGKKILAAESKAITKEDYEKIKGLAKSDSNSFTHGNSQYSKIDVKGEAIYQSMDFFWDSIFIK